MSKENFLFMRFLFCKIHCPPFICFCKPSPIIYTPGPLRLENSPHVTSPAVISVGNGSSIGQMFINSIEAKEESSIYANGKESQAQNGLRSSIKKEAFGPKEVERKKVQWMDLVGKELVEIREYEPSETEDSDDTEDRSNRRGCVCTIL